MIQRSWTVMFIVAVLPGHGLLGQLGSTHIRKGDGGPATLAEVNGPTSIAIDKAGNLFVNELSGGVIRRIDATTQIISTVAQECYQSWEKLLPPGCVPPITQLRIGSGGSLLLAAYTNNRLLKLDPSSHIISVIVGNGALRSSGDGGLATDAGITIPSCFAHDGEGNLLVCDSSGRIRRVHAKTGIISTVAGTGKRGFGGDGGPALDAKFGNLLSLAVDRFGNIYIADDTSNRIRRVDARTAIIDTFVGSAPPSRGRSSFIESIEFAGEGEPAIGARFNSPHSLIFDRDDNLIFAIPGRVCRIDKQGYLRTIARNGKEGSSGDGGEATRAQIEPAGLAMDEHGNLFIAEYDNNRIRRVDGASGVITTVAGNGLPHRQRVIM